MYIYICVCVCFKQKKNPTFTVGVYKNKSYCEDTAICRAICSIAKKKI